jgi:ribose 5-phosphate isomerase A
MTDKEAQKKAAAEVAVGMVPKGCWLGVGTGSTIRYFIQALKRGWVKGAVPSSVGTEKALRRRGIRVLPLSQAKKVSLYVDGADEADAKLRLIKGGGGALTREKIVATAAKKFICIADEAKLVKRLGKFPVPVEIVPFARALVAKHLKKLGGRPVWRKGWITDNGGEILDVHGLKIRDPQRLEKKIEAIPGVICAGIFARRRADLLLLATPQGVRQIKAG